MRFLLFCTFLSFSHCLIGQKWQPAEWIIFGAKRDSGWVRLPINGLKHATDIKLKSQSKHH